MPVDITKFCDAIMASDEPQDVKLKAIEAIKKKLLGEIPTDPKGGEGGDGEGGDGDARAGKGKGGKGGGKRQPVKPKDIQPNVKCTVCSSQTVSKEGICLTCGEIQ